jgi:tRNA threonylcarbamoyladenosine biosynthesis protein TsaB
MKVLAIDTSTMLGGIAIMDDLLGLIVEARLNVKSTHSERLMTTIDYALKQSGYTISDMDIFAVATGPGSFTGLRIGLSTVKGFSYATGKPIVSVPTLEALAQNFPFCRYPVCTMLDARKKEVYVALFEWKNEGLVRLISEMSVKVNKALERINEHDKVVFTGDGVILYKNEIVSLMGERAVFASPEKMVPSPANVACIGVQKALRGEFSEPVNLVPFYIRRSEAEIKAKS